jgi:uncharacterized protein YybS (DUF2232 family)
MAVTNGQATALGSERRDGATADGPQTPPSVSISTAADKPWIDALGLAEGGLLADVGVVLDLASIYLPIVGTALSPTVPTPFAVLMVRRGPRVTLLAIAVATFLITVLAGPHFGWRMGLEGIVGMLMGWAMRRRIRPVVVLALGTFLVATTVFIAALLVIFVTGLPIKDIQTELRNGLGSVAWAVATGASLFGGEAQWLSIRPALVAIGLTALRLWPLLLFLYVSAFALPTVTLYYAVANATVRVLGLDAPPFPPLWAVRLVRGTLRGIGFVLRLPFAPLWLVRRKRAGRQRQAQVKIGAKEGDRQ